MRLYFRGKYWWVAWPGGERQSTLCTGRAAAERWAKREELRRADPAHAAAAAATLGSLITRLKEHLRGLGRSAATLDYYDKKLGHLARVWGVDLPLSEVTAERVDRYLAQRRDERAGAHTLSKEASALGLLLRRARRWGLWSGDVAAVLPVDHAEGYTPRSRWLTPDELRALAARVERFNPSGGAAILFAVATGARRSEIARATRADLEQALVSGQIEIRGSKTARASGRVPVLSIYRSLLEQALAWAQPEGLAFGDWPLRRNAARSIKVACVALGIAHVSWNDLRRTHARWLRRAGVDPELIGEQLRHTSPAMARRVYAQIEPGELGEQIERTLCPAGVPTMTDPDGLQPTKTDDGKARANVGK